MRKVKVHIELRVSDSISNSDLESYFDELEGSMQESFDIMPYDEDDNVLVEKINVLKN